jgi:hypothetical protein
VDIHVVYGSRSCLLVTEEGALYGTSLGYLQPGKKYTVNTVTSNTWIGGVVSQTLNAHEQVVAYFNKILSKPERNYCMIW